MDVRLLYTNIPYNEGIKAVEMTLNWKSKPTMVIITFLKLILALNDSIFNCEYYLQVKGYALETKCTPTYANFFMEIFDDNCIYHLIKEKCKLYLRYIGDIFLIWTGALDELNKFIAKINKDHSSTKFGFNYSSNSVNFLDITLKKVPPVNFPPRYLITKQIVKLVFTENQNTWSS